jgi:hypothetical protein
MLLSLDLSSLSTLSEDTLLLLLYIRETCFIYSRLLPCTIKFKGSLDLSRMPPKKNQKSNQGEVADDFDDMLAGFRAADLANAPSSQVAERAADTTPSNAARAQPPI